MHSIRNRQGKLLLSGTPIPSPGDPIGQDHLIEKSMSHYDGLPFPTDMDLVLAIRRRLNTGHLEAAVGLVSQFRERLLHHPESQDKARAHGGEGSTMQF